MRIKLIKYIIVILAYLAVLYPLWVRLQTLEWSSSPAILTNIFPLFGLTAFSLLWLHSISGVFEPWLRKNFDFDSFVHQTSLLIFICLIFHPLLLLTSLNFKLTSIFLYGSATYVWLGIIGWALLITYDIGKALKKRDFFIRHWNKILLISTIGFLLTFFHSLGLGGDLQSGPLRIIWIFYGTTAILATIYTYGIRKKI